MNDLRLEKCLTDFKNIMKVLDEAAPLAPNIQTQVLYYTGMCKVFLDKVKNA